MPECFIHEETTWWMRADGSQVCALCHPDPRVIVPPVEFLRNVKAKRTRARRPPGWPLTGNGDNGNEWMNAL